MATYQGSGFKLADFKPGERVIYLPIHANGDTNHADAEHGKVSSIGGRYVFVLFTGALFSKAVDPNDLVKANTP
jgi:hypothetical protein